MSLEYALKYFSMLYHVRVCADFYRVAGYARGRDTFTCINYNRQRGVFPKQPNSAAICQHCVGSFLSGART